MFERRSDKRHFTFELDGLPPGAQAEGARLTFTAVSGTTPSSFAPMSTSSPGALLY